MIGSRKKQDILAISVFVLIFVSIYFILTKGTYLYGSTIDWTGQHYLVPEYFRNLFYETKNLFPDFAANLGAGQNIYYFSYYGLLNPYILISYLLPFVSMVNYIQIVNVIIVLSSVILFYFYLRKHTSFEIAFLVSILFLTCGPLIFHSHRHWMFISYFPFYMMALFGLDRFFDKGKLSLFTVSLFLMIMTSYYYSVGAFASLFSLGIYRIMKDKEGFRKFLKLCIPFLLAILAGMVLLLPTLYTLLCGRKVNSGINIFKLFIPDLTFTSMLYQAYSMGLTSISLITTLYLISTKKRENIFMGVILLLMSMFPIVNYILNGTLYINPKSLIPFVPVMLIFVSHFLEDLFDKKIALVHIGIIVCILILFTTSSIVILDLVITLVLIVIYIKTNNKWYFIIPFVISAYFICIGINITDTLGEKKIIMSDNYHNMEKAINYVIENDDSFYRINNSVERPITLNRIVSLEQYATSLYSSTFNQNYNSFYFNTWNNEIPHRNRSMTPESLNPLFQIFMGEKYFITTDKNHMGGKLVKTFGKVRVYEQDNYLPFAYASSNLIKEEYYDTLKYPNNVLALLSGIVTEDGIEASPVIKKVDLNMQILNQKDVQIKKTDTYHIKAKKKGSLKVKIDDIGNDKVIFMRFHVDNNPTCSKTELAITINGVKNKLSCKGAKYHNKNYTFDYVIKGTDTLNISFTKGIYDISKIKYYILDINDFKLNDELDEFKVDRKLTKGNSIIGSIDVKKRGYFTMSIPYDKGFKAYVDGVKVKLEEVNKSFIGFKINEGSHDIKIVYEAPYKKLGMYLSIVGIISMIVLVVFDKKKKA